MCELSNRKHFKSIFDSGLVKFCVRAILKEQCRCRRRTLQEWLTITLNTTMRGVYHSHPPTPPVQTQYVTIITNTAIHNKATTPTTIYPLAERNIHLNKQFNITLIIMSLTGSCFSKQVKNVSRATFFQISNSVSIIRRGRYHPNHMLHQ